jgi:chitin disaccharide deacetylase
LVAGRPTLPPCAIPLLVDKEGAFRSDMVSYGCLLSFSAQARLQLAAEITAQFEAFHATGLVLDHCNAHKHFHLHPVVGALLITIGRRFGLRAVRTPLEPRRLLQKIEPTIRGRLPSLIVPFSILLRRRVHAAALLTTDQVFGLDWSGHMTKNRLLNLIRSLPRGLSEIYLHPATAAYSGDAPGYRYRDELDALIDSEVIAACRDSSIKMGGFSDFLPRENPLLSAEPCVSARSNEWST